MMKLLTALIAVMTPVALAAAGSVKPKIFSTHGAVPASPTVTISIEELERQADMRTLPVTEIENLY